MTVECLSQILRKKSICGIKHGTHQTRGIGPVSLLLGNLSQNDLIMLIRLAAVYGQLKENYLFAICNIKKKSKSECIQRKFHKIRILGAVDNLRRIARNCILNMKINLFFNKSFEKSVEMSE